MSKDNYVRTINFGDVVIRKTYTNGIEIGWVELSDGTYASIRTDYTTNQPFAVLFDENLEMIK
jgi:iron uptake system EfeUOB component EfeO/EfeM